MSSGGEGGEGVSEDSLESSLTAFQTMPNDFRSALDDFRSNWQRELKQKQNNPGINETSEQQTQTAEELQEAEDVLKPLVNDEQAEQQALAKNLFHKAVELEQSGKVYDAIPFYRKAVQIEPDIEFKYYEHQKLKTNLQNPMKVVLNAPEANADNIDLVDEDLPEDLYEKFQLDLSHNQHGQLIQSSRDPGVISTEMHISELPPELLIYILRWVVSNQLDMRSLEQCAAVCKGMYLLARDEELWKSASAKVWGNNVGTLTQSAAEEEQPTIDGHCPVIPRYATWRQMFIERERVLFSGCYISKTTYLRMGENSFQDQYYRPVQLVEYYRYIRFLPDGTVLMMTSSDEPAQGVTKLKNLHQLRPDILRGQYRLFGSTLTIVVSKQQQQTKFITNATSGGGYTRHNRRASATYDEGAFNSTKYCIEFRILNKSKKKFAQLVWLHYSIVQTRNKHETTSEFELNPSKYPPLWFSPVRSYHLDADAPLA
ncbi:F-box only protein 9 [Calliphora vicina]|uniref:F-box only protein 9 n=1 Tax=Calliphora vicina TaxID=7373 RepID=UPI00325BBD6E